MKNPRHALGVDRQHVAAGSLDRDLLGDRDFAGGKQNRSRNRRQINDVGARRRIGVQDRLPQRQRASVVQRRH
jgi:hypothetical protein